MALDIQSQIELFSSQAGALCHMLTFYHGCHLDSFPWQRSDGGLLTHAERWWEGGGIHIPQLVCQRDSRQH